MTIKTYTLQAVEVDRGRDTLTLEVPAQEVSVLRAVHRPDNVRVTNKDVGEVELDDSAFAEYDRLHRKYERTGAVRLAFPDGAAGLEKFGFDFGDGEDNTVKAPQSSVRNHAKEAKAEAAKATKKDAK